MGNETQGQRVRLAVAIAAGLALGVAIAYSGFAEPTIQVPLPSVGLSVGPNQVAFDGVLGGSASAAQEDPEAIVWRTKAAILDPRSYVYLEHGTTTVPEGEAWQSVSLWRGRDSTGDAVLYQREADARRAISLPPGTQVDVPDGVFYGSRFALVADDTRYATAASARALYFERLARLQMLPIRTLTVRTNGARMGRIIEGQFPNDVRFGMVVGASVFDAAWVALRGDREGVNLVNEISDDHQVRNAEGMLLPFDTQTLRGVATRPATYSGTGSIAMNGVATVMYVALPEDW